MYADVVSNSENDSWSVRLRIVRVEIVKLRASVAVAYLDSVDEPGGSACNSHKRCKISKSGESVVVGNVD